MRRRNTALVLFTLPLAGLGAPTPAAAQWTAAPEQRPAWLGVSYDVHWVGHEDTCQPRLIVETVVEGAPADRAGLRPGDAIVAMNGESVGALRLGLVASRLSAGDSIRLRVARSGELREVIAVADHRPARPPTGLATGGTGGFRSSDAPVVHLVGDTVVARNVDGPGFSHARGYWVADDEGGADYRRIDLFSSDPLDRRVAELIACAGNVRTLAPAVAPVRVDLRALQARADSLREVLTVRALTRAEADGVIRLRRAADPAPAPQPLHVGQAPPAPGVYTYHVRDHVAAAERGVAGAEVTALEPELAEYFRGARDGLLVLRVAPGSPAARAGLRPGDVITSGAGRSIQTTAELRLLLTLPDPTPVELRVVRHGRTRTLTIRRE